MEEFKLQQKDTSRFESELWFLMGAAFSAAVGSALLYAIAWGVDLDGSLREAGETLGLTDVTRQDTVTNVLEYKTVTESKEVEAWVPASWITFGGLTLAAWIGRAIAIGARDAKRSKKNN